MIIGILIATFFTLPFYLILFLSIVLLAFLLVTLILAKKQIHKTIWFGLLAYFTTVCIGVLIVQLHNQKQFNSHYTHSFSSKNNSTHQITFKVKNILKPTLYHDKYIVDILKIDNQTVTGKLLFNIDKDSLENKINVDDVLFVSTSLKEINRPLNPYQFNYSAYLKKQYVYYQISTDYQSVFKISSDPNTISRLANKIHTKISNSLEAYHFKPDELAIINALLLGQRHDISSEVYDNYASAGAIHILAVSGLHVGIIFLILNFCLKPIERLKNGKYIKITIVVLLLWCFAVIAGLRPSVTRAVTMFTVIAIAMNLKRPSNIYNTLAISMFFLLLFKPLLLFDVGFQMSYIAVLAIVSIQPLIIKVWTPKYKLVNYFWNIFTVTIAAQIGVLPISLYYFHQFPGLFFVSNLVILPFLGLILGLGFIVIILASLKILPQFVADIYGGLISLMNHFIEWVSQQESFLFKDISFGIGFVIATYLIIISVTKYFKKPNYLRLSFVLISVIVLQSVFIFNKLDTKNNELVIFHKSRHTIIGLKENNNLTIAHTIDSSSVFNENSLQSYSVGNYIKKINQTDLKSVYTFANKKLLVIDSLGVYNVKSFHVDYILLRNSPKVNLKRLTDSLKPELIIADGSNYKSYTKQWEETCKKLKIPFYKTSEKGAFIISK
ncbi:competence protein ComEC [Aquaticitalea lipolytica]|uniref:Competence protein ComEC n=1 Tax=Aquaticitalea lipolytica TaxID=1247562 RepID=A0A8J2XFW6_9FLAO|nr:competence protein ComEC [Aquaticitalea lipolytica]